MKYLLILLTLVLFGNSCENFPEKFDSILFKNNSPKKISLYFGLGGDKDLGGSVFPDTLLPMNKKLILPFIPPNETGGLTSQKKLKEYFKLLPKDTFAIFVIATDTIDVYSWEEIRSKSKYLKRYDLSYENLEKFNFEIVYK